MGLSRFPLEMEHKIMLAFLPIMIFVAILIRKQITFIVNYIINFVFFNHAVQKAYKMRAPPKKKEPVRVRQTDIVTKMNSKDRAIYRAAEKFEQERKFIEAAQLFEAIKFQRRAIDLLELNGYLDEACAVLVRLGAQSRAGVLYERNKQFHKAAYFFEMGKSYDQAAKNYLELSKSKFEYYLKAAECYEKGGLTTAALKTFYDVADTGRLKELAFRTKSYEELCMHLRHMSRAPFILLAMNSEERSLVVRGLKANRDMVLTIIDWLQIEESPELLDTYLKVCSNDPALWQNFCEEFTRTAAYAKCTEWVQEGKCTVEEKFRYLFEPQEMTIEGIAL